MTKYIVATENLTVHYQRHRGIGDLNLQVQEGEIYGLLGPNGAGKTATMRVLMDVIRPQRGWARIFGLDCQKDGPEIRRRIGYIPGELSLYPQMRASQYRDLVDSLRGKTADPS